MKKIAADDLFEIGGHTLDHFLFSKQSEETKVQEQIIRDKQNLEKVIGQTIKYFAYPFGQLSHATPNIQKVVQEAGYQNAFTIIPGFATPYENPFLINRDSLELFQSSKVWDRWLHGGYDTLVQLKLKIYNSFSV